MDSNVQNFTIKSISFLIIFFTIAVIVMDSYALYHNQGATKTISAQLRNWNAESGGLIALSSLGLWIHLFVKLPYFWTEEAANDLRLGFIRKL